MAFEKLSDRVQEYTIVKATIDDAPLLAEIGSLSFTESHGHSATVENIDQYINKKYTTDAVKEELGNPKNIYYIIKYNDQPAGYSKIILNCPHPGIPIKNITKLERLYLLKEFYDLKLGLYLFQFNLELSKHNNQLGMWLFVWTENHRAIRFYENQGFEIIGEYKFEITASHSNPNYHMFLKYGA